LAPRGPRGWIWRTNSCAVVDVVNPVLLGSVPGAYRLYGSRLLFSLLMSLMSVQHPLVYRSSRRQGSPWHVLHLDVVMLATTCLEMR
jgi:hypothetical protein